MPATLRVRPPGRDSGRNLSRAFSLTVAASLGLAASPAIAAAQDTVRISVDSSGVEANWLSWFTATSADGRYVAFESLATNLVSGDTNGQDDTFVHDRVTGVTERVSVDSSGAQGDGRGGLYYPLAISADGQVVAFESFATNLVAGDTNGVPDIFVRDRSTGITERVSVDSSGVEGNDYSESPAISADGRIVAFVSFASNLVASDTNFTWDVFVHDRVTGVTERVSVDSTGWQGDGAAVRWNAPALSADGQIVAFSSGATNLVAGDANASDDLFVHDRATGVTERVSLDSSGTEGDASSYWPVLSADGAIVAFWSDATNLVANDTNHSSDVFVHDRSSGVTERVSVRRSGAQGNFSSFWPTITADGRTVAFTSAATNLIAGDGNGVTDIFVHDRLTGTTERVSVDSSGGEGNGESGYSGNSAISADGQIVAFNSEATNLVPGDTNGDQDVFVHEFCSTTATWSNYGAGFPGTLGVPSFTSQSNPVFGATVTLDLGNSQGSSTVAVLCIGFQRTSLALDWGGDLLVAPMFVMLVGVPPAGVSGFSDVPNDRGLCGLTVDLQAFEYDLGAAQGASSTPGLELLIGH